MENSSAQLQRPSAPATSSSEPVTTETLIAGAIAGVVAETLMHPFETISLRAKVHPESAFGSFAGSFRLIYAQEGLRGYFAGVRATMMSSPVSNAVYFTVYERLKYSMNSALGPGYEPVVFFAAGGLSELASSLLVVPMEVVKARLQLGENPSRATGGLVSATYNFRGIAEGFQGVYRERGFRGLTAGWNACLLLDMCYSATQFFVYEVTKAAWTSSRDGAAPTTAQTLLSGSIAGGVAALVTNPLDVVTSRLMVQDHRNAYGGGSILRVLRATMAEAPIALWRGTLPRVAQLAPLSAVNFFVYEAVRKLLKDGRISGTTSAEAAAQTLR